VILHAATRAGTYNTSLRPAKSRRKRTASGRKAKRTLTLPLRTSGGYKHGMDEEVFNLSVRRFLKKLGVTAQREIELGVRERLDSGELGGDESLPARATVTVQGVEREIVIEGEIKLS
jgi:Family of unknown function (DUF6494)